MRIDLKLYNSVLLSLQSGEAKRSRQVKEAAGTDESYTLSALARMRAARLVTVEAVEGDKGRMVVAYRITQKGRDVQSLISKLLEAHSVSL